MTDDPDAGTGGRGRDGSFFSPAAAELRLHGSLDLAEISRLTLDIAVPDLADAAAVFAVERAFRAGEPMHSGTACRIAMRRLGTRLADDSRPVTEKEFPAGEVVIFDADGPYARCVRSREPMIFDGPDGQALDRASRNGRKALSRYDSFLVVPVMADGYVIGFLALARTPATPGFRDRDLEAAARLAAGTGTGVGNALRLRGRQSLIDTMQRGLLVVEPPAPPGIEVAARSLPAAGHIVGGDWHDLVALPGGRCLLLVGDVMGHGPEAGVVMAQLRAAAHALAQLDTSPAELLTRLDRFTATIRRHVMATCVCAVLDPADASCTVSAAGHLPPILALPDGTTAIPDLPDGQFLGLGTASYGQARVQIPAGTVIALYTDGLVETRLRSFEQGIRVLRAGLARHDDRLETACDALIAAQDERYDDDVTVVLARLSAAVG